MWPPPTKPNTVIPARAAAVTPGTLSSITRHSVASAPHARSGQQKQVGGWLAVLDLGGGEQVGLEELIEADDAQRAVRVRSTELDEATQMSRGPEFGQGLADAVDALEFALEGGENVARPLSRKSGGNAAPRSRSAVPPQRLCADAEEAFALSPPKLNDQPGRSSAARVRSRAIVSLSTSTPSQSKMMSAGQAIMLTALPPARQG